MAYFELFGPIHQLLTTSVQVRSARHNVLSGNIANVDTPGYRPRDLNFAGILRSMVHPQHGLARNDEPLTLISTNSQHHRIDQHGITERPPDRFAPDNKGVDLESEVTRMVENSLHHETSLTLLSRTLGGLRYAISEGRR